MVGLYFGELFSNGWIILREASQDRKGFGCGCEIPFLDHVAGCLRKDKHANNKNYSPGKLHGSRDAI